MAKAKDLATLDLDNIIRDQEFQQRAGGCNPETVEAMAEALKAKPGCLPRVKVHCIKGIGYALTDGFQRCEAHEAAGLDTIQAEVRHGTRFDAALAAAESNREHDVAGDKRTNADKRRAVLFLFAQLAAAKEDWTDKRIAEHVGVSPKLVKELRPTGKEQLLKSGKDAEIPLDDDPPVKRTAADGRQFTAPTPKAEPSPSLDSDDPRDTPLAEFLDVPPEVWTALDRSKVETVGQLDDRLKAKPPETFGLTMDDLDHLRKECAAILAGKTTEPAKKPKEKKAGEEKGFDFREFDRAFAILIQGPDAIAGLKHGEDNALERRECLRFAKEFRTMWDRWQARLKLPGYTSPR